MIFDKKSFLTMLSTNYIKSLKVSTKMNRELHSYCKKAYRYFEGICFSKAVLVRSGELAEVVVH